MNERTMSPRPVSDALTMIGRGLRLSRRNLDALVMAVLLPVMLLALFVYVFGGAIHTGSSYINYVVPGIIVLCAGFGSATTAVSVCADTDAPGTAIPQPSYTRCRRRLSRYRGRKPSVALTRPGIITGMHAHSPIKPPRGGLLLCLAAAAGFSTTGIFAKLAYASQVSVTTLLSVRFLLAAVILWLIVAATRQPLPSRRTAVAGFVLGLAGYGLQVTLLFLSLERIDASLSSLLFYLYPALVTAGALLIGRERVTWRRGLALAVALAGVVLVFAGAVVAHVDSAGVLLSVAAAAVYAVLILVVDTVGRDVRPLVLSTWVSTGAAVAFALGGLLLGGLRLSIVPAGWGAIVGLAVLATVVPLAAFYAGIARVGPSTASIILTVEPALTVILAAALLRETLGVRQFLGGALILTAVLLLQARWGEQAPSVRAP